MTTKWRKLSKWKLMLTTLPMVAVVLGVQIALESIWGYSGSVKFSDITPVLTGVAFLIGFMLAGTMADYKEAEKIPGDLASTLESIEDTVVLAATRKGLDVQAARGRIVAIADALVGYLQKKRPPEATYAALAGLDGTLEELDKAGAGSYVARALGELSALRKNLTRVEVIANTGFLAPGYALLDVMVGTTIVLLLVSKFDNVMVEYIIVTFITLVYLYMVRLIRDVDNPFELSALGSAEVDLAPLTSYRERVASRLAATPAAAPLAASIAS